jgi:hypothetical protein
MANKETAYLYCAADRLYYETPDRLADQETRYRLSAGLPEGWQERPSGLWNSVHPKGLLLPEQGWKIHISAIPASAQTILTAASAVCFRHGVAFKYLRSEHTLLLSVGKHMPRASSGKFVTVYPADEEQFTVVLGDLVAALDGQPGPYILSDLRISRGPVYVRYGAFTRQWCPGPDGDPVLALREPSGSLIPDDRLPVFRIPGWVTPPAVLMPHLAQRSAPLVDDFPYVMREALYFSNSGGIYLAEHRDSGDRVVLREARPHCGFDSAGSDALARLYREHQTLQELAGLACVPRVYGITTLWEHHFLIEEYIEGQRLLDTLIERYPLVYRDPPLETIREYLQWADGIIGRLSAALDAVHARGLSSGDLHPANVMIRPDGSPVLIDFEYSTKLGDELIKPFGAPGYTAPRGGSAADSDRYGLRAIWLTMMMPLVELAERDAGKTATLEEQARTRFRLPADAGPPAPVSRTRSSVGGEDAVRELFSLDQLDWPVLRDRIAAGIYQAATPERTDRLFPADPEVFTTGGFTLAHGAAGVLLALHRTGAHVPPEYVDWLIAAARRAGQVPWRGLFDGLYGTALVLHELGRPQDALEVLDRARTSPQPVSTGLFGGLAGAALAQCYFADMTGDAGLLAEAITTAERLDSRETGGLPLPASAGLMHGMTGVAMLQIQLYRLTMDARHLSAARRALDREIGFCVTMPDGTCQVRQSRRHLLYLDGGSSGIALAAQEYLAHIDDASLMDFVSAVRNGCGPEFVREPGLFQGRSGLLAALALLSGPELSEPVLQQVSRLRWHAVHRDDGLFFPGVMLMRFSSDLATGSAGVLMALQTAFCPDAGLFPFLPNIRSRPATASMSAVAPVRSLPIGTACAN